MEKYIYILLIAIGLYSCDLDETPSDAVTEEMAFNNVKNAEYAYNGTWAYFMDTYYSYQNPGYASFMLASDAMGSDVSMQSGKYGYYGHYSYTTMASTSSTPTTGLWIFLYRAINNSNLIIDKIDDVPGNDADRAMVKGQAYALRGFAYLNLAAFYGHAYQYKSDSKCVPIYTKPTVIATEGNPKSTVAEVYKQAEEDLLVAYDLLKDYKQVAKHNFDKHVVAGVLARVYAQRMDGKSDWENLLKYAGEAQKNASFMSKSTYLSGFNDRGNAEWIWGHGQTTEQSTASYSFHFKDVYSQQSYYYSFFADPYFLDFFKDKNGSVDNGDIRSELFEWDLTRFKGGLMYKKFLLRADRTADIVLMRKAEMVLLEAEAKAELSDLSGAVAKINELRQQRGAILLDESDVSTKETFIKVLMIERRKELFGEGFSLSDIKRRQGKVERKSVPNKTLVPGVDAEKKIYVQGHTIVSVSGKEFVPNSDLYNFAIPATETTNNPNLNK